MSTRLKITLISLVIFVMALIATYLVWHMSTPRRYQLDISNESSSAVSNVGVFGMGAYQAESTGRVGPGQIASIIIKLKTTGDLRFVVEQKGGSKIDYLLARDVAQLQQLKQWLTIKPDNRFLIQNIE